MRYGSYGTNFVLEVISTLSHIPIREEKKRKRKALHLGRSCCIWYAWRDMNADC